MHRQDQLSIDLITQECRIYNTEGFHAGPELRSSTDGDDVESPQLWRAVCVKTRIFRPLFVAY